MSKTLRRSSASSEVRRSTRSVATLPCWSWWATKLLRGLNRPLPLPWAKTTTPSACAGRPRTPSRERGPRVSRTVVSFMATHLSAVTVSSRLSERLWENRPVHRAVITQVSLTIRGTEKQNVDSHCESDQDSSQQQPLCPCHGSVLRFALHRDQQVWCRCRNSFLKPEMPESGIEIRFASSSSRHTFYVFCCLLPQNEKPNCSRTPPLNMQRTDGRWLWVWQERGIL